MHLKGGLKRQTFTNYNGCNEDSLITSSAEFNCSSVSYCLCPFLSTRSIEMESVFELENNAGSIFLTVISRLIVLALLLSVLCNLHCRHCESKPSARVEFNRSPCKGKVSISEIRIPLMWKDSDHFKNKGSEYMRLYISDSNALCGLIEAHRYGGCD